MVALLQNKAGMNPRLWNMCCPTYFAFPIVNQSKTEEDAKPCKLCQKGRMGRKNPPV